MRPTNEPQQYHYRVDDTHGSPVLYRAPILRVTSKLAFFTGNERASRFNKTLDPKHLCLTAKQAIAAYHEQLAARIAAATESLATAQRLLQAPVMPERE